MDIKPMTTNSIAKILREDPFSKTFFIGVFPRDQLPIIKSYPASFVINTDPSYKEGEHWLGFYFDRNKTCYFFDSFGNSPEYFNLGKYTKTFSNSVEYNEDQIQGFFTNTCGHYVVFFILMINRGFSIRKILSCFNLKNFDLNDFRISFID
jgi:hypothetical protein